MKKTINNLFAALTIIAAASCTKDIQPDELNDGQSELRTIELSFEDSGITKVGVSDRTPQWEAGDKVWVSNGTASEEVTLAAGDITSNVVKISTSLSGTLYAVYPASAQNGVSSGKIGFKIPTSTDGAFGNAHIAVAEGTTSLTFRNVVSILKITTEAATKLVNISSASAIAGEFKVTYDTRTVEAGTTQAKGINITSSAAGDKYVAVASGLAFNALEFTVVGNTSTTDWATKKSAQTSTTGINTIYDMGNVSSWGLSYVTNESLWAKFSVADKKQVRFSKGNLYAKKVDSSWIWGFYADQHQYNSYPVGTDGKRTAASTDIEIDNFCWGYDATGSVNPVEKEIRSSFTDWGQSISTLPGNSESTKIWKTLSSAEWTYLLNTRSGDEAPEIGTQTDARYVEVKVNGVCGLLIFPDTFTWPEGISTSKPTTFNTFPSSQDWNNVNYTAAEFILLESAGCVFLPAAGYRDGSDVDYVGSYGSYWSSTPDGTDDAYGLDFNSGFVSPSSSYDRYYGCSVRLVSAAQ